MWNAVRSALVGPAVTVSSFVASTAGDIRLLAEVAYIRFFPRSYGR